MTARKFVLVGGKGGGLAILNWLERERKEWGVAHICNRERKEKARLPKIYWGREKIKARKIILGGQDFKIDCGRKKKKKGGKQICVGGNRRRSAVPVNNRIWIIIWTHGGAGTRPPWPGAWVVQARAHPGPLGSTRHTLCGTGEIGGR